MPSLRFLRLLSELRGYLRVPAQSFRMALPSSLLTEWPAEAPWRSTQKKICGKRFCAALWKVRNTAMQTPTKLLPAVIPRGLMLFSITDSATRSFSAGRVTARQSKDAWPRQRANRSMPTEQALIRLGSTELAVMCQRVEDDTAAMRKTGPLPPPS